VLLIANMSICGKIHPWIPVHHRAILASSFQRQKWNYFLMGSCNPGRS